jgi:hypothetical protein
MFADQQENAIEDFDGIDCEVYVHSGDSVELEKLQDTPWDKLNKEFKGTLIKAVKDFKEQAVAGLVSLGTKHQVGVIFMGI